MLGPAPWGQYMVTSWKGCSDKFGANWYQLCLLLNININMFESEHLVSEFSIAVSTEC